MAIGLGIKNSLVWEGGGPEMAFFILCVGIGLDMRASMVDATWLALVTGTRLGRSST